MDSIIFDIDGTIWNSTDVVADAWNATLEKENIDIRVTARQLQGLFGRLLPDIAKAILPEYSEAQQLRIIDLCCQAEHEALRQTGAPVYQGLEATLKELSSRYPLFVVSNCQAGYIELVFEKTGLGCYFTGHLCPGDTGEAKAANIRSIVQKYHLKAPVYVGDTFGDYQACQEAGVPFVFASYGFGQVDTPDYTIQKPADLLKLF
ncbi:HAD family hydrolase [Blautia sp. HCP3S3_H10_1]|uniref:HAD family hydrolase n=1 Tax=unclassified Blautia TaxID=2648079 RepID=UPI003F92FE6C|nr:HAD family hydrolase [Clostridia bacterium]